MAQPRPVQIKPSNNNSVLYNKLVKEGKEQIKIRGYKYVYKNKNTLVPKFGIIAKMADYTPYNEHKKEFKNELMNDKGAYRIALFLLNDVKVDPEEWEIISIPKAKKKGKRIDPDIAASNKKTAQEKEEEEEEE